MASVPIYNRRDEPIDSVESWEVLASPGEGRWADDYSAKALAEAWIDGRGPAGLTRLVGGSVEFEDFVIEKATAEAQTHFDHYGGPRNHDLLVRARDAAGPITVGLEGKVNERFGETVDQYVAAAQRKSERDEPTNAPARLADLLEALTSSDLAQRPELGELRYQLFSATAGTLAAADDDTRRAIFVVHELHTPVADERIQAKNREDLADFVELALGLERPSGDEWIAGPARARTPTDCIPGDIDLWIGHIVTS